MGRKFGGPEIALIAVALAFAVPLTAWWHGLYQQPDTLLTDARCAPMHMPSAAGPAGEQIGALSTVGYFIEADGTVGTIAVPSIGGDFASLLSVRTPKTDPNQTLLLAVAVLGSVAAAVYSVGVYPSLRR
jgi:hypothetical protein